MLQILCLPPLQKTKIVVIAFFIFRNISLDVVIIVLIIINLMYTKKSAYKRVHVQINKL